MQDLIKRLIDSGSVGLTDFHSSHEGYHESRRCSRDTYPESYITEYTLVYKDKAKAEATAESQRDRFEKERQWTQAARGMEIALGDSRWRLR